MRLRIAAVACLIASAAWFPAASQQMLNLRDADVRAFIQDAARVTGRTFIVDPRVKGTVSVVTDRALSKSEYFELFLSTLRANGVVAVPAPNGTLRIQPAESSAAQPVGIGRGSNNKFVTEVFRLHSTTAESAAESIRSLVSKEGSVTANRAANSIVVADYADNIRRVRDVLNRLDRDISTTRMVALHNAGAREIASSLQQLAGGGDASAAAVNVVAIDSSNSIGLRGSAAAVERFAQIAQDLDRRAAGGSEIRVIFLQHAEAEKLVPVLQQLVGQNGGGLASASVTPQAGDSKGGGSAPSVPAASAPAAGQSGGGGTSKGGAIIARYEGANAVIISAPSDIQRTLGEVVRQLDTRREQVLVEAIIVEISDTAAKKLGVQFLLGGLPGSGVPFAATNYSNAQPNLLEIAGAVGARKLDTTTTVINGTSTTTTTSSSLSDQLAQAAVTSLLGAGGGLGGYAAKIGKDAIFAGIINAVNSDSKSNILSTPSVLTLDNQEAKLLVGQEIPITTGQALSQNFDNQFRTVQRQNVGIQLDVKPQINAGGSIKLFLHQEVSSIAGPVTNNSSDLILNKRSIETTVTVDDGQIIALGGLLDDNERRTLEKIPFLGDIPGLGQLFRSKSKTRAKTNLMVFIRPTILRTAEEAASLASQRYNYVRNEQLAQSPNEEPGIDELVREYMGTTPPVPAATAGTVIAPDGAPATQGAVPPPPSASRPGVYLPYHSVPASNSLTTGRPEPDRQPVSAPASSDPKLQLIIPEVTSSSSVIRPVPAAGAGSRQ
jgi:general secretion pathway protein D